MRRAIRYFKDRYWATLAVATISPGVLTAAIEYIVTKGVSGLLPLGAAALGGCLTIGALKFIETPDVNGLNPTIKVPQSPDVPSRRSGVRPAPGATEIPQSHEIPDRIGLLSEDRFFSPRTPDELVHEVKGLTDIVAKEVSKRHISHWLRVEGRIRNVQEYEYMDYIFIYVAQADVNVDLILEFDRSYWRERLIAFNVGDHISAIGKIKGISSSLGGTVSLDECELVND